MTTRIETIFVFHKNIFVEESENSIHYNKD